MTLICRAAAECGGEVVRPPGRQAVVLDLFSRPISLTRLIPASILGLNCAQAERFQKQADKEAGKVGKV